MMFFEPGLYLRVEEMQDGPKPLPLDSGFSTGNAYRAMGLYNPSETSDAYFVLSSDRDEICFICNRHLRTHVLKPEEKSFRLSIKERVMKAVSKWHPTSRPLLPSNCLV